MDARPNYKDTEEEILRQQTEFVKNRSKPSVTLIKSNDLEARITNAPLQNDEPQQSTSEINLIGRIIQKETKNVLPPQMNIRFNQGFPQAKRRNFSAPNTKGSIFSQTNKRLKHDEKNMPEKSYIVSDQNQDIHLENLTKLSEMSESEILEEKNKLLNTLNPGLIKFLQSKRTKPENTKKPEHIPQDIPIEDIHTPKEIIDQSENWLHFDTIETEKLQWMKNIEKPEKSEQFEARFDFSGILLPFTEELTEKNRSLYHHGEEPGRPGYTLKELFKLCRSNVHQQRILALNTISNILSLNSTGIYDNIIDIPIEQIFFVIRISLDDNIPTILNASLKSMHSLIVNQIDERCLDLIQGFGCGTTQPMLSVDQTNDDKDMNDQLLAETDLIKCLVRSDILARIRYIINTVKPNFESVNYCLEILIRLTRDSDKIVELIYKTDELISSILKYFVPKIYKLDDTKDNCYGQPMVSAIKLLTTLCCRSRFIAVDLLERYNIFDALLSYISNQITGTTNGVKIQVEAYKLVAVLFKYNLGLEHFSDFQPFLLSSLDYHFRNSNSGNNYTIQSHFSALLSIVSEVTKLKHGLVHHFVPLLIQCLTKLCAQFSNSNDYKCEHLQSFSAILFTLADIAKAGLVDNDSLENVVFSFLCSSGFERITENIKMSSNLLCVNESHKSSANLATLESAVWSNSEHIVPVLGSKSCVPFLAALSYYVVNGSSKLGVKFIEHPNINKYLLLLKNAGQFYFTNNWFTRLESKLVMNIFKSVVSSQNDLQNLFLYYELAIKCLSIFTIDQSLDIDWLLRNIVFNKQFYPNEVLMQEMNISGNTNEVVNIMPNLFDIYLCYSQVLALKKNIAVQSNFTIDIRTGNIIPVDWIFAPIVTLYTNFEDSSVQKIDETRQILVVTRCLQWIFLYEQYFPTLSSFINITDRFCRLSCIFLCSNTLFLEQDVHKLLELCLGVLVRKENLEKINFTKSIQGLNNFQDFYVQLLEQYQGVSYGDKLFANFILIPLAQRHGPKWRKILWSEYLGVAQTINLDLNQIISNIVMKGRVGISNYIHYFCPPVAIEITVVNKTNSFKHCIQCLIDVNEFLQPPEIDLSLLKCYRRALVSEQLNRSPFLKFVANFHVENYVKMKKNNEQTV